MNKYIWSDRYGKNPSEGLHKHLQKVVPNYKRSQLDFYLKGFNDFIGKPQKSNTPNLASNNFIQFTNFIRLKFNSYEHT